MMPTVYDRAGSLVTPGDLFENMAYYRVRYPFKVVRKYAKNLPAKLQTGRELKEVFEVGKEAPRPPLNFSPPGEEAIGNLKFARAIFLTWGSEVDSDIRDGNVASRDWHIAPVFPLADLAKHKTIDESGNSIYVSDAIMQGKSPKYFPLPPNPDEPSPEWRYVDFRRICLVPAVYVSASTRSWRLGAPALNGLYVHLMWFFTRKKIFFSLIKCPSCGNELSRDEAFEGQKLEGQNIEPES